MRQMERMENCGSPKEKMAKGLEWREKSGQEMRDRRRRWSCFLLADSGGQLVLLVEIRN